MCLIVRLFESRRSHPDGLDDLEDCGPDDHEDEERDQLGGHGVAVLLLGGLAHVAALEKGKKTYEAHWNTSYSRELWVRF